MRSLLFVVLVACGGTTKTAPLIPTQPIGKVGSDLAGAKDGAKPVADGASGLLVKDPRLVDLDLIRVRVRTNGVGSDLGGETTATGDLWREANELRKAGKTGEASARYRHLVTEFPDSNYAPLALFNIAAIADAAGDRTTTITVLNELVKSYPSTHESVEGHLYIAALQAEKAEWDAAATTLETVLARPQLTYEDRVEAHARLGYIRFEQQRFDDAEHAFTEAIAQWRRATRIDDPYYIAMAHYYRGEVAHKQFALAPIRPGDEQLLADIEQKRVLAVRAYEYWKASLTSRNPYWATAAGFQMSNIFFEVWDVTVKAPFPTKLAVGDRPAYTTKLHGEVRDHLQQSITGHKLNVELAKAYGVETQWSRASAAQLAKVQAALDADLAGKYVTPSP